MRIGVLASGGGTNLQSIIDACSCGRISGEVALVISNNSSAPALERARKAGISTLHASSATHPDPAGLDGAILEALKGLRVDIVALAGYMKKVGSATLRTNRNRMLNIHPALLPDFGGRGMYGMAVHRAVLASGVSVTGPTVHLVGTEYDTGPILAQEEVPVLEDDTPDSLQQRVLEAEHRIYPDTIEAFGQGVIAVYPDDTVIRPLCITGEFDEAGRMLASDRESLRQIGAAGGVVFGAFADSRMLGCAAAAPSESEEDVWKLRGMAVSSTDRRPDLDSMMFDHVRKAVSNRSGGRVLLSPGAS